MSRTTRTRIRGGRATTRTTRDAQGRYSGSRGGLFVLGLTLIGDATRTVRRWSRTVRRWSP